MFQEGQNPYLGNALHTVMQQLPRDDFHPYVALGLDGGTAHGSGGEAGHLPDKLPLTPDCHQKLSRPPCKGGGEFLCLAGSLESECETLCSYMESWEQNTAFRLTPCCHSQFQADWIDGMHNSSPCRNHATGGGACWLKLNCELAKDTVLLTLVYEQIS